jgi:hypothetical protein
MNNDRDMLWTEIRRLPKVAIHTKLAAFGVFCPSCHHRDTHNSKHRRLDNGWADEPKNCASLPATTCAMPR